MWTPSNAAIPRFVGGIPQISDMRFSNCTHLWACGRFSSSSVQRECRV